MRVMTQRHESYGQHTVLSLSILEGRPDIAEWLVGFGADFDARDGLTGFAPLHHAVRKHCLDAAASSKHVVTNVLLENGAFVDIRDKQGTTPLMLAALYGDMAMVCVCVCVFPGAQDHAAD